MDLELNIESILNIQIKGNQSLLGHVFLNLIKNAMEHFREEGLIKGEILFLDLSTASNIVLSMSNSGRAIPKEIQTQILGHFTSKSEKNGSGLGLIFCKQILKRHGGNIKYDSNAKNPTFLIYFPKELKSSKSKSTVSLS